MAPPNATVLVTLFLCALSVSDSICLILWPDTQSTYFIGRLAMPAGSTLTLRFKYPQARYFQFALYKAERDTFVSIGEALAGQEIEPDPGSIMQVPIDAVGNYTIVVSRREDRPKNATLENGVAWLEWSPRGEGLDDPRNRADFGMLMMRIMANNPNWAQSPKKLTKPGTEEAVMGPYYPRGEYTDKATFEAKGPNK